MTPKFRGSDDMLYQKSRLTLGRHEKDHFVRRVWLSRGVLKISDKEEFGLTLEVTDSLKVLQEVTT